MKDCDPTKDACESPKLFLLKDISGSIFKVYGTCIHHGQWPGEIMVKEGKNVVAILGPHGVVCRVDFKEPEC